MSPIQIATDAMYKTLLQQIDSLSLSSNLKLDALDVADDVPELERANLGISHPR